MTFHPSLYPSLICEYGYSSRNQPDANLYKKLRETRIKAKHSGDKKTANALKLPLNTYYGALGAKWNALADLKQCRSICISGQCVLLILIHDLRKIPTLKMISSNTDACQFEIDDTYMNEVQQVIDNWQKRYRLELERDDVLKIVMKDINNYCEIVQTNKGKQVNFKGSFFAGCPNIKIHEDGRLETIYKDSYKANSMIIVAESVLKYLLFDIAIEKTINNCNDIFKFMQISHLGSTYEKCVQESENGDIELQRNNRIYAGLKPSGKIVKIKPDGRRDSLANCPENPIVDNGNKLTINDINKEWYIEEAKKRVNDFLGIQRIETMKKDELLKYATDLSLKIDKKTKKDELIKLVKNQNKVLTNKLQYDRINNERVDEIIMATKQELEEKLNTPEVALYRKIMELRQKVRNHTFILDQEMPSNLGGKEIHSTAQYYDVLQDLCLEIGLDFSFDIIDLIEFDRDCTKPTNGLPIHVATVKVLVTLTDIDTGCKKENTMIAQGNDTINKAVSGAGTLAFRHWFIKNFTPKNTTDEDIPDEQPKSQAPKTPVYIPEKKKEELKKEVVKQKQQEETDDEDIQEICETIMKIRELTDDEEYGEKTMQKLLKGTLNDVEIEKIKQKVNNKLEKVEAEING